MRKIILYNVLAVFNFYISGELSYIDFDIYIKWKWAWFIGGLLWLICGIAEYALKKDK